MAKANEKSIEGAGKIHYETSVPFGGASVHELRTRQVEADHSRARGVECDRPLRGTAAELEQIAPGGVAEDPELFFRDPVRAPRNRRVA